MAKVKVPPEVIVNSDPEIVKVISELAVSVAVTVPIAVWFSAALKVADELITGAVVSDTVTVLVTAIAALPALSVAL